MTFSFFSMTFLNICIFEARISPNIYICAERNFPDIFTSGELYRANYSIIPCIERCRVVRHKYDINGLVNIQCTGHQIFPPWWFLNNSASTTIGRKYEPLTQFLGAIELRGLIDHLMVICQFIYRRVNRHWSLFSLLFCTICKHFQIKFGENCNKSKPNCGVDLHGSKSMVIFIV